MRSSVAQVTVASALLIVFAIVFSPGCSSSPGSKGFTLFPQGHKLLSTAKDFRDLNAQPLAIPRELEKEPLPAYIVEPGDVLLIQPVDLDSKVKLPADQPVLPDGTINLGKYGQHIVAGKTVKEIEQIVKAAVADQTKEPGFISVRLVGRQSKVYYVLGEVNSPGVFQLSGRETVLDGIIAAGGLTNNSSRNSIILSRPSKPDQCRTVLPVCYKQIVQLGDTTTNYQLAPGDRIYIPTRSFLQTLFGGKFDHSPCKCLNSQTPCVLPPYHGAPEHMEVEDLPANAHPKAN